MGNISASDRDTGKGFMVMVRMMMMMVMRMMMVIRMMVVTMMRASL